MHLKVARSEWLYALNVLLLTWNNNEKVVKACSERLTASPLSLQVKSHAPVISQLMLKMCINEREEEGRLAGKR